MSVSWYVIERRRQIVSVLPDPLQDEARAARLRALLPTSHGWLHYPHGVSFRAETEAHAAEIEAATKDWLARETSL